ncbi:uncharacterized protein LOC105189897 isoform X2 [Harpegnathos saltator]|uniref:uncharacterized protein LOC105189897 isoform X2 n=1 Tax=Harpegnathos saltator TaxID=610380 RepID=UPI000DBEF095|nr:uncharacterized protein LOC105189897 isoform X2 [Harpegnathos saltator]
MISSALRLIWLFEVAVTFRIGAPGNRVVDRFTYAPRSGNETENGNEDVQWEFLVIGKRVSWNEAQAICPIYGHLNPLRASDEEMGHDAPPDPLTREPETDSGSTLAVLDGDTKDWFARMVAESNYRYDGLWIGGQRKDFASDWGWIDTRRKEELLRLNSLMVTDHTAWYVADERRSGEKNCLMFDRLGHDSPLLVPEDCRQRKPFVCMRAGKKKARKKIIEGSNVFVDGQRYTLYQIFDEDEDEEDLRAEGVRRVDGGGIAWRDARLECKKRRKQLAMIFTNEAATVVANAMLKSRPSIESAWLDGRSVDGTDWTWTSSGFTLPSKKSNITSYPPWSDGHPTSPSESDDSYRTGRCLILDRHLCAKHTTPAFLDLDCEKKRPFVCQDAIPERRIMESAGRSVLLDDKRLIFSFARMTWKQGEAYCRKRSGRVASILDARILSAVLEKMTELALDHTWVGGHTVMSQDGWKWVDENDEVLSKSTIGTGTSWCFDEDDGSWPYADREICLNLDREGHDMALFYGLPCNTTSQYVLCNLPAHRTTQSTFATINETMTTTATTNETEIEENIVVDVQEQATDLAGRIRKLAKDERSGLLFVMDDSLSVLNAWFAEEMKLAATVIRRYFPLSHDHPMGLITFSENTMVALSLNQTDTCNVLSTLSKEMLANRATRISEDLDGVAGKTTDLINAALMSADVVRNSVFVTDGEHIAEEKDRENLRAAVDNLQNLRNDGHEAFAIVISQGQKHAADYDVIEHLFATSLKGERNLYFVEDYNGLREMNSVLNLTGKEDYAVECEEIQWTVPKDNELLAHLLLSKK